MARGVAFGRKLLSKQAFPLRGRWMIPGRVGRAFAPPRGVAAFLAVSNSRSPRSSATSTHQLRAGPGSPTREPQGVRVSGFCRKLGRVSSSVTATDYQSAGVAFEGARCIAKCYFMRIQRVPASLTGDELWWSTHGWTPMLQVTRKGCHPQGNMSGVARDHPNLK